MLLEHPKNRGRLLKRIFWKTFLSENVKLVSFCCFFILTKKKIIVMLTTQAHNMNELLQFSAIAHKIRITLGTAMK